MTWTNRGAYLTGGITFRAETAPATWYAPFFTSATAPTVDHNVNSDLTQIATGNGYTDGGPAVARSAVGFDVLVEDDTNDRAHLQLADVVLTASGGAIPSSGNGARYMGLSDDNATVANRQLVMVFDLVSDRTVSDGQNLTVQNAELRLTPA